MGRTAVFFTNVEVRGGAEARQITLHLRLSTETPNFSGFEVRRDGGPWQASSTTDQSWVLRVGDNMLEARSVNLAGVRGETARVRITSEP